MAQRQGAKKDHSQRTSFAAIRFGESVKGGFPRSPDATCGSVGGVLRPDASRRAHRPDDAPCRNARRRRRFVLTRPAAGVLLRAMEAGFALPGDAGLETGVPIGRCRSGKAGAPNVPQVAGGEFERGGGASPPLKKNATCIGTRRRARERPREFRCPARSAGRFGRGRTWLGRLSADYADLIARMTRALPDRSTSGDGSCRRGLRPACC